MNRIGVWLLLAGFGVFCLAAAAQAVIPSGYELVILDLPSGSTGDSEANVITNSRKIAGSYSNLPVYWSWDDDYTLRHIPVQYGYGKAFSMTSWTFIGEARTATGRTRAFVWHLGDAQVQYYQGYLPGLYDSVAYGIGERVVGCCYSASSQEACYFNMADGTAVSLSPGKNSIAYAANSSKIAGWEKSDRTGGNQHAVLWNNTNPAGSEPLDITPDASQAAALALNNNGVVTGYISIQAFIWDINKGLRKNFDIGQAKGLAINDKNQVVGSSYAYGSWPVAFIWEEGQGTVLLNSLAMNRGNFELAEARGINFAGEIVGWGYYPASQPVRRAFLLRPLTPNKAEMLAALNLLLLLSD